MHGNSNEGPNPSGLCMCGCGRSTRLVTKTNTKFGLVKGTHRKFVHGHTRKGRGCAPEHRAKIAAALSRERSRFWKGGRATSAGRVLIFVGHDHPMAQSSGYVPEHRLIASATVGRYLTVDEAVHHVDLDKTNNDASNLAVLTAAQHSRLHNLVRYGADPVEALAEVRA